MMRTIRLPSRAATATLLLAAAVVFGVTPASPGSVDRGLWQINSYWHSEVSDTCAYDAQCNANAAYRISSGGSNWSPWVTYNTGAYLPPGGAVSLS